MLRRARATARWIGAAALGSALAMPAHAQDEAPAGEAGNCRGVEGESAPKLPAGPRVTVGGMIQAPSDGEGQILIEVMDEEKGAEATVYSIECLESGPFEVELARGFGKVRLVAFFDVGKDGPTKDDPAALSKPLDLSKGDVSDVVLKIVKGTDLGRFTPVPPELSAPAPERQADGQ